MLFTQSGVTGGGNMIRPQVSPFKLSGIKVPYLKVMLILKSDTITNLQIIIVEWDIHQSSGCTIKILFIITIWLVLIEICKFQYLSVALDIQLLISLV